MNKNIYSFEKAKEKKQYMLEMKEKHFPQMSIDQQVIKVAQDLQSDYIELLENYKELAEKHKDLYSKYNKDVQKLVEIAEKMSDSNDRQHDLYSLIEHFIVKNKLVDQYVDYLKEVAENEELEEYRKAAEWKFKLYHYDYNGETQYFIDDHYGWIKEEEAFED